LRSKKKPLFTYLRRTLPENAAEIRRPSQHIIVVFGRRPRIKTSAQVIAELEALLALGKRDVFIVGDRIALARRSF